MRTHTHAHAHVRTHVHMHTHARTHTRAHTHAHARTCPDLMKYKPRGGSPICCSTAPLFTDSQCMALSMKISVCKEHRAHKCVKKEDVRLALSAQPAHGAVYECQAPCGLRTSHTEGLSPPWQGYRGMHFFALATPSAPAFSIRHPAPCSPLLLNPLPLGGRHDMWMPLFRGEPDTLRLALKEKCGAKPTAALRLKA